MTKDEAKTNLSLMLVELRKKRAKADELMSEFIKTGNAELFIAAVEMGNEAFGSVKVEKLLTLAEIAEGIEVKN